MVDQKKICDGLSSISMYIHESTSFITDNFGTCSPVHILDHDYLSYNFS